MIGGVINYLIWGLFTREKIGIDRFKSQENRFLTSTALYIIGAFLVILDFVIYLVQ